MTPDPDHQPDATPPPAEERIDPAAIAQGVGEVTGGLGTLALGAAALKQTFGGKEQAPPPPPPPTVAQDE